MKLFGKKGKKGKEGDDHEDKSYQDQYKDCIKELKDVLEHRKHFKNHFIEDLMVIEEDSWYNIAIVNAWENFIHVYRKMS